MCGAGSIIHTRRREPGIAMPARDALKTSTSLLLRVAMLPPDQDAWRQFARRYGPCILRWCCAWGAADADAEDITQNVLTTLSLKLPGFRYDPARSFRSYLKKVAADAFRDAWRKNKRHVAAGGSENVVLLSSQEARDDLVSRIEREFDLELLEAATQAVRNRVERKTWDPYHATACESRPACDVAQVLGMSVGGVYKAKSSVLRMLREELRILEEGCDPRSLN
jgi:RNA polymerase sigma-70 factor (ECF subfamily)